MKRIALVTLFVLGLVGLSAGIVGCFNPPQKTMWLDTDLDGTPDILAVDANEDGIADEDEAGNPILALTPEEMKKYQAILASDKYGPEALALSGGLFGLPILVAIGGIWRSVKFGRVLTNTILSIQNARSVLKAQGPKGSLEILDAALDQGQVQGTRDAIEAIKGKLGVKSVNEAPAS